MFDKLLRELKICVLDFLTLPELAIARRASHDFRLHTRQMILDRYFIPTPSHTAMATIRAVCDGSNPDSNVPPSQLLLVKHKLLTEDGCISLDNTMYVPKTLNLDERIAKMSQSMSRQSLGSWDSLYDHNGVITRSTEIKVYLDVHRAKTKAELRYYQIFSSKRGFKQMTILNLIRETYRLATDDLFDGDDSHLENGFIVSFEFDRETNSVYPNTC